MSAFLARRAAVDLAARLRRTADQIDRRVEEGPRKDIRTLETDWNGWASDIVHDMTSLIGNSYLDALVRDAGRAQQGEVGE